MRQRHLTGVLGIFGLIILAVVSLSACIENRSVLLSGTPDQKTDTEVLCEPQCDGKDCGDDGCGGICGLCATDGFCCVDTCCPMGSSCNDGACGCVPDCDDRVCGGDGCDGSCGQCDDGFMCAPSPTGTMCKFDCPKHCDGRCGQVGQCTCDQCPQGQICQESVCKPEDLCASIECPEKTCANGVCHPGTGVCQYTIMPDGSECNGGICEDGKCVCVPDCEGKECGPSFCGGNCGICVGQTFCCGHQCCPLTHACTAGTCGCTPDCQDKECGEDGCGGLCGDCGEFGDCVEGGCGCTYEACGAACCGPGEICHPTDLTCCQTDCLGGPCGPDGCGGHCGPCIVAVLEDQFNSDQVNLVSNSDWERSYCSDNWRTDLNGGVTANRDDGCEGCDCDFLVLTEGGDSCVNSDPFDNHIQTGNKYWQNYRFNTKFKNADDDAMGVVFRYHDSANFYLFVLSRHMMPDPDTGCNEVFKGARLVRIAAGEAQILEESPATTYQEGQVHRIQVTAQKHHIRIDFDKDGDGEFSSDEVFYDKDDDAPEALLAGRIGLFAYDNGIQETGGEPAPCANKNCWFDNVRVDVLPPNSDGCGDVAWEGFCDGDTLWYCDVTGQLHIQACPSAHCCRWVESEAIYTCVPPNECAGCSIDCKPGEKGCTANLTHRWFCGQGDDDACLEPKIKPCLDGSFCNPVTGDCDDAIAGTVL